MWASSWLDSMRSHLNRFRNGHLIADDDLVIQQTFETLKDLKITNDEITGLLEGVRRGYWLTIPLLSAWLSLEGVLIYDFMQRGRKFKYNDEWDKYRAAAAVHIADCFVTDKGMSALLKQIEVDLPPSFVSFSVGDTKGIVTYLKTFF
jgi:hypothetical protein